MPDRYRVAVIGSTGRGGFAHGLDLAFCDLEEARVVAAADHDPEGLAAAGEKIGVSRLYTDYRRMLEAEKPDICVIAPGWVGERVPMVEAAAAAGCHIYLEKPAAGSLAEIDAILAAVEPDNLKVGVAHQWRAMAPVQRAIREVAAWEHGRLLRLWGRPKDDSRGGGEELLLHGTHMFDLMIAFARPPRWVSGHVAVGDRDAAAGDARDGSVGLMAGDSISAMFGFDDGARGFWDSTAGLAAPERGIGDLFGVALECERARLELRQPGEVFLYPAPRVLPDLELDWERLTVPGWHEEEHFAEVQGNFLHAGNRILARDLMAAIAEDREPLSSIRSVRYTVEMVQGVYASHLAGGVRLSIPLQDRIHPLKGR